MDNFSRCQSLSKGSGVESLVGEFSAVFLQDSPVIFHGSVRQRCLVKCLHDGNASGHHGSTKVLHDVETVKDDLSLWK